MVYYCSVKGCKNNSKMKKKDPSIVLSFHAFPVKETNKQKWLRAIGRPSWKPPSFARICSTHFDLDQICHEGCRIRMLEDACPVNGLPPNSNFEASDIEVCRMCLGTDMKMFSLQDGLLNTCLQSFTGLKENCSIEGLPQFVCYECSARLINCYNLIEQNSIAQAVLLDLFTKNGQVTKNLVKTQDRKALGLESSLHCCNTTDLHQYTFNDKENDTNSLNKLNEGSHTTEPNNLEQLQENLETIDRETDISKRDIDEELNKRLSKACDDLKVSRNKIDVARKIVFIDHEYAAKEVTTDDVFNDLKVTRNKIDETRTVSIDHEYAAKEVTTDDVFNDLKVTRNKIDEARTVSIDNEYAAKEVTADDVFNFLKVIRNKIDEARTVSIDHEHAAKEVTTDDVINDASDDSAMDVVLTERDDDVQIKKGKNLEDADKTGSSGFNFTEKDLLQYFRIATLTRKQQKQQWQFRIRLLQDCRWLCEECDRQFATNTAYNNHMAGHDPSRGKAKCPICFLRFKTKVLVQTHVRKCHEKIFYCKSCPNVFHNAKSAKTHHLTHTGHTYKCSRCDYTSKHASAVDTHVRSAHAHALACPICGRPVPSERGMKMHLAMAHKDADKSDVTKESPKYPCQECDIDFVSEEARRVHLLTSKQHRKIPDLCDPVLAKPDTKPACSKCGAQFTNMRELVTHTRAEHPRPKRTQNKEYPVKCEHCEEMLSNRSQHWLHVRKQHPKEKHSYRARHNCVCQRCGKQFQNSTKVRAHELSHGPARLTCPECPRTFHHKYALARHASTHARPSHACEICTRAFTSKHNLARHQRVHTGETPYACNVCDKRFKHSTSLALHVRSVHCNEPPLKRSKLTVECDSE